MSVRCGNRKAHGPATEYAHHEDAATVRACYASQDGLMTLEEEDEDRAFQAGAKAERDYELYLETRYSDVIQWEEEQDRRRAGLPW